MTSFDKKLERSAIYVNFDTACNFDAITFFSVYTLSSILSRNLRLLSYALSNVLTNKSEIKLANSFIEIGNVREKLAKITKIFTQSKRNYSKTRRINSKPTETRIAGKLSIRKTELSLYFDANGVSCF